MITMALWRVVDETGHPAQVIGPPDEGLTIFLPCEPQDVLTPSARRQSETVITSIYPLTRRGRSVLVEDSPNSYLL